MQYRCDGIYRGNTCNRLLFIGSKLRGRLEIKCDRCNHMTTITDGEKETSSKKEKIAVY